MFVPEYTKACKDCDYKVYKTRNKRYVPFVEEKVMLYEDHRGRISIVDYHSRVQLFPPVPGE